MTWLIPFALGALLVVNSVYALLVLRRMNNWLETPGRILNRELERDPVDKDETETVLYEYVVDGKRYTSSRVRLGVDFRMTLENSSTAQERLDRYSHIGQVVTVFYDPQNPRRACLEKSGSGSNLFALGIGLVLTAMALWFRGV